jgi:hypothetical protein
VDELPENEVAVYEDEVDIHFNPKVGLDWMPRGHQRHLLTPGVNQKAYLAGSLDVRDSTVLWVGDCVKNSGLFVRMLERLWQDLHANVTRNHRHTDFVELCHEVASYLDAVSPWLPGRCPVWAQNRVGHDAAAPHE